MSAPVLKIATLNAWGRMGPWRARRAVIADGLRATGAHVVALNEVWEDATGLTARELADAIGGEWVVHFGGVFECDGRVEGNALLSRYPLIEGEAWPLPEPRGDHARGLLYARIDTPWGELPVFVTHLSSMAHHSAARLMQLQQVREWVKERAPIQRGDAPTRELPPVLAGDLNAEPDADEIRFLRGLLADPYGCYFADCFAHAGDGSPGYTWHRANAYAAREPHRSRRLDYIFVRGPDRWRRGEPLAARIILDEPRGDVYASDHYGVYAELRAEPYAPPPLASDGDA